MSFPFPWSNWRDDLQPASFRNKSFWVDSTETLIGRQSVKHRFPYKDTPFVEDLGQEGDEFTINAYVIQNSNNDFNHFEERDDLIEAFKTSGIGRLVHPFYGEKLVSVVGLVKISESYNQGGITRFTITFSESTLTPFPEGLTDSLSLVDDAVQSAFDAFLDEFAETYSEYMDVVDDVLGALNAATSFVNLVNGAVSASVAAATGTISGVIANVGTILNSPCTLAANLISAFNAGSNLIGLGAEVVSGGVLGGCSGVLRGDTYELPAQPVPNDLGTSLVNAAITGSTIILPNSIQGTGTSSDDARASQEAVQNICRNSALATAAQAIVRTEFSSVNDMNDLVETLGAAFDAQLLAMGDSTNADFDSSFAALQSIRNAVVTGMRQRGVEFANVENYLVPPDVTPTLVLSYQKYGTVNRADEIFKRNQPQVQHPGFLPSGEEIELLAE